MTPPRRNGKNVPDLAATVVATHPPDNNCPVLLIAKDEGRFGRINPVRCCWAPPGVRPRMAQQAVRESVSGCAAVALAPGRMVR